MIPIQAYKCKIEQDGKIFPEKVLDIPVFILKFAAQTVQGNLESNFSQVITQFAIIATKDGEIEFCQIELLLIIKHKENDSWELPLANYLPS